MTLMKRQIEYETIIIAYEWYVLLDKLFLTVTADVVVAVKLIRLSV